MSLYLGNKKVCPIVYVKDSGETITAINKTGTTITTGQKVWLNENQQTEGTNYQISHNVHRDRLSILSRNGNFAISGGSCFVVTANEATKVFDLDYNIPDNEDPAKYIKYMDDNSIFTYYPYDYGYVVSRVDNKHSYILKNSDMAIPLGKDLIGFYSGDIEYKSVRKLDLKDGSVIKMWVFTDDLPFDTEDFYINYCILVGDNKIYNFYDHTFYTLNDDLTVTETAFTMNEYTGIPIGVTNDNKYIICDSGTIVEIVDDTNLRKLQQEEMPTQLQNFYDGDSNIIRTTFNPYTGILTITERYTQNYAIMKYENGAWTNIPVNLNLGAMAFDGHITVSDDLRRASWNGYVSDKIISSYIVNLTTLEGYEVVPFNRYNINENTITGIAKESAESNQEIEVNIVGE